MLHSDDVVFPRIRRAVSIRRFFFLPNLQCNRVTIVVFCFWHCCADHSGTHRERRIRRVLQRMLQRHVLAFVSLDAGPREFRFQRLESETADAHVYEGPVLYALCFP